MFQDEAGVVGYACAAPDYRKFRTKQEIAWIPEMCQKYPENLAQNVNKTVQVS